MAKRDPRVQALLDAARAKVTTPGYTPPTLAETLEYAYREHGATLRALADGADCGMCEPDPSRQRVGCLGWKSARCPNAATAGGQGVASGEAGLGG